MAEKTLKTRILLKYDTYANWAEVEDTFVPKKGEVCFIEIPGSTGAVPSEPAVVFKVGDGETTLKSLPYGAGISADVYAWAKAASKPEYTADEIEGLEDFISGEIQDTNTTYRIIQDEEDGRILTLQSKEIGGEWKDDETITIPIPDITVPEYTIVKANEASEGAAATYMLQKDGETVGEEINIPKDYLVKSAEIKTAGTSDVSGFTEGTKYIDFVINTADDDGNESHIYLNVEDLVDVYTAGNGIEVSDTNEISVKVTAENGLSVDADGIKLAVATEESAGAMSAEDKATINGLADIATTGNVNDLIQDDGDILIFDCGDSTDM